MVHTATRDVQDRQDDAIYTKKYLIERNFDNAHNQETITDQDSYDNNNLVRNDMDGVTLPREIWNKYADTCNMNEVLQGIASEEQDISELYLL